MHRFSPFQSDYVRLSAVFQPVIDPFIARFCPFSFSLNEREKKISDYGEANKNTAKNGFNGETELDR
jgi:hypothetical protein